MEMSENKGSVFARPEDGKSIALVQSGAVHEAFRNAENIDPGDGSLWQPPEGGHRDTNGLENSEGGTANCQERTAAELIVPLGHSGGIYYLISPSCELRSMKAEALEAGRGVRALLAGITPEIDEFEPGDSPHYASRQDSLLASFQRMSGDAGGLCIRTSWLGFYPLFRG